MIRLSGIIVLMQLLGACVPASPAGQPSNLSAETTALSSSPPNPSSKSSVAEAQVKELTFGPGHSALVRVPAGEGHLPAIFVTHGAGGTAEAHLDYWVDMLEDSYIVFSIRGVALNGSNPGRGYYYPDHLHLKDTVLALIEHLQSDDLRDQAYVARLAPGPWVYAGYSQGATMGALFVLDHGNIFDRLILIEGGTEGFSLTRTKTFRDAGGRGVHWVCGTSSCEKKAQEARSTSQRVGLTADVEFVNGAGHIYWGPVGARVRERLSTYLGSAQPASLPQRH